MKEVYITSFGVFLPGDPVSNEEIEDRLGRVNGKASVVKGRILNQNGIRTRYFAMDSAQNTRWQNAEMAALAIRQAMEKSYLKETDIQLLMTATTQADLPVPGFASMVHARTAIGNCELASYQSVCAGSLMALQNAQAQLKAGLKRNAVCVASESPGRLFKASRFEAQGMDSLPFDTEFLRWMLSDGAGAAVLQTEKTPGKQALEIEWIDIRSHATDFPLCMYAGRTDNKNEDEKSWLDYPSYDLAVNAGALNLKQDIRLLERVVKMGVSHLFALMDNGSVKSDKIDWLCCHYSSEVFKKPIVELLQKGGVDIPEEKWFTNLHTKGNTGAASILIMLEELFYSGRLADGETILCMVPESGRGITSFMQLKVHASEGSSKKAYPLREVKAPELNISRKETNDWLVRQLTTVWIDFETALLKVPVINKMHKGEISKEEYLLLMKDLRQQVIDGSQWIARAASNISIGLFDLRSAFLKHAATEHRDYQMLEANYKAMGGDMEQLYTGQKNIGSVALSTYMFQQAGQPDPLDLMGAMFIIEGIGKRLAAYWGEMIKDQLELEDRHVSFFTYHGTADEHHFKNLEQALEHPALDMALARRIVQTAKVTARLYRMQLEELGNY